MIDDGTVIDAESVRVQRKTCRKQTDLKRIPAADPTDIVFRFGKPETALHRKGNIIIEINLSVNGPSSVGMIVVHVRHKCTADAAPVYAAPVGTTPTVDIPFERISDSGYDAIGEIPVVALNSESAEIGGTSAKVNGSSVCGKSDRVSSPCPGSSKVDCGSNSSNTGKDIADGSDGAKNAYRTQLNDTNGTFDKTPADRP